MSTDFLFRPGKLTTIMDGQFGSSGKGKIASYIGENSKKWQFACNAFSAQAGHWVKLRDGRSYFYQHLNSVAYLVEQYEKLFIGPSACIELPALLREIKENKVPADKLGISPRATIITDQDMAFERGTAGFDGAPLEGRHAGTAKFGSTCHGVGSATARKVLRRPSVVTVDRIPDLQPYLCDVAEEITDRLEDGQAGILELAQGYPLSLNGRFFPYCTSRNVTVAQGLSDMFLAPKYAGPVVINLRTLPIRINSRKFIAEDGRHLTWAEVQSGIPHKVYEGNSGPWYPDQKELTWEEVTTMSGSKEPIVEITSVTKLPRRVATFSLENLNEAIRYNDTGRGTYLSLNFANYVDSEMRGTLLEPTGKFRQWMVDNLKGKTWMVEFIGTGPLTDETINLSE